METKCWKGNIMLNTACILDSITGTVRADIDVGVAKRGCTVALLLGPPDRGCLKNYCLCNVLL
jgi:hypothetical protein